MCLAQAPSAAFSKRALTVYRPDGSLLEGQPIMPDVPIEWTQADVAQKRDPDLAAALDLAGRNDW